MLIPAKDVPLFREFIDPATKRLYARLAQDKRAHLEGNGDDVLAVDGDGGYWSCSGDYLVELKGGTP